VADDYWIKEAIEKPGVLRQTIRRRYGKRGFTEKGAIKPKVLRKNGEGERRDW